MFVKKELMTQVDHRITSLDNRLTNIENNKPQNFEYNVEEQKKAVYALNLCTVSISQIVDYNDIGILEQEYEAILNNLNIENMPKDEPLLKILKQILDTITFFRIQEKEKDFIEKDYQQKMKDAIWKSVPNLSVIVASGNPFVALGALATQVGIGYMNYRKEKAKITNEHEKEKWELQKSALEQFNALRRELFDTSWRMAKEYKFPDCLRLTEKQIKQYNEILMETDCIRKYDRLAAINQKDFNTGLSTFDAYAPYWYFLGDAACQIYNNAEELFPEENLEESKAKYYKLAKEHFETFLDINNFAPSQKDPERKYSLLRVDQIASSCYLEHIDLLDFENDKEEIKKLLDKTIEVSGLANDIVQICAMDYLKLGEYKLAQDYLYKLVANHYNETTNAQLLSRLYLDEIIKDSSKYNDLISEYEKLKKYVPAEYLYKIPRELINNDFDKGKLIENYNQAQRKILLQKFGLVFNSLLQKYIIIVNKTIENPYLNQKKSDDFYLNDTQSKYERQKKLRRMFETNNEGIYLEYLKQKLISITYWENLDKFYGAFQTLDFLKDINTEYIERKYKEKKNTIENLDKKLNTYNSENTFDKDDLESLLSISFEDFINDYITEITKTTYQYVSNMKSLNEYIIAEGLLRNVCVKEDLPEPDFLYRNSQIEQKTNEKKTYLKFDDFASKEAIKEKERIERQQQLIEIIKQYVYDPQKNNMILTKNDEKLHLCIKGNTDFSEYLRNHSIRENVERNLIAVLEKKSYPRWNLLLTTDDLYIYKKDTWKSNLHYSEYKDLKDNWWTIKESIKEDKYLYLEQFECLIYEMAKHQKEQTTEDQNEVICLGDNNPENEMLYKGISSSTARNIESNLLLTSECQTNE